MRCRRWSWRQSAPVQTQLENALDPGDDSSQVPLQNHKLTALYPIAELTMYDTGHTSSWCLLFQQCPRRFEVDKGEKEGDAVWRKERLSARDLIINPALARVSAL